MRILGISGSLRQKSFNTALLRAATSLAPDGMEIEMVTLHDIPLYNRDVEVQGFPDSVQLLKEKIKAADGVLIISPEYNHSIPGVLKNALDWVSRSENELSDKPLAIGGASDGLISTARMQVQFLAVANTMNAHVMSKPLFQVPNADKKIDEGGDIIDEKTTEKLKEFLNAFKIWVERLK